MSNHKQTFSYYCETENVWIYEERTKDSVPTKCKNSDLHTIRLNSVSIYGRDFCNFTDDVTIPESFSLLDLDYSSLSGAEKKIVEILKALLICAKNSGVIKL